MNQKNTGDSRKEVNQPSKDTRHESEIDVGGATLMKATSNEEDWLSNGLNSLFPGWDLPYIYLSWISDHRAYLQPYLYNMNHSLTKFNSTWQRIKMKVWRLYNSCKKSPFCFLKSWIIAQGCCEKRCLTFDCILQQIQWRSDAWQSRVWWSSLYSSVDSC